MNKSISLFLTILLSIVIFSGCAISEQSTPEEESDSTQYQLEDQSLKNANKTATYSNEEKGISFVIPYNDDWANPDNPVQAYSEELDRSDPFVGLAPLSYPDASSFPWMFHLTFESPKQPESEDEVVTINGLQVIKYVDEALCFHPTMVIVGNEYNYKFSSSCAYENDIDQQFEYLEEIVKSVNLDE